MNDEIRRETRAIQAAHEASLRPMEDALEQLFDPDMNYSERQKSAATIGSMTPSGLFKVGGLALSGAAILAACSSSTKTTAGTTGAAATTGAAGTTGATATTSATTMAGTTPATMAGTTPATMAGTTAAAGTTPGTGAMATAGTKAMDIIILRTASSIEELAVAAYQIAIDSGLVKTAAIGDAAKLFQAQHKEHSALFQAATKNAGGEPFTMANPAVLAALQPTIKALTDETGIVKLAFSLETAAAETYQSNVGMFMDLTLNAAIMSVGGVEARHAAVLATVLAQNPIAQAFQAIDMAVKAGTGV